MNHLFVDGHNLAWQSYYAAARSDRNFANYTPDTATEVVYGCLNVLAPLVNPTKNLLGKHHITVALDAGRNWRQAIDPSYKDGRGGSNLPTTRFGAQICRLPDQLAQFGIRTVSVPSLEGDDIVALLAERPDLKGVTKVLMSRDKDTLAFVAPDVYYFNPSSKTLVTPKTFGAYTQALFKLDVPLSPQHLPLFRALVGDASDCLPGVPQCQEAWAIRFVQHLIGKGAQFTGYAQSPDSLMAEVKRCAVDLPSNIAHLGRPDSLAALQHTFTLVQVSQAPAQLQKAVFEMDISPLPQPTYPQIKAALEKLNFKQFLGWGEKWAAGFTATQPPPIPTRSGLQAGLDLG